MTVPTLTDDQVFAELTADERVWFRGARTNSEPHGNSTQREYMWICQLAAVRIEVRELRERLDELWSRAEEAFYD